uniref:Uncharacterized protein n=1 Tax=Molossus molossus TaxID=27622 RepID=A0A7J8IZ48_MOLMO|nr:hypothetical protein HJG59_010300 [Molossus molossus]
MTKGKTVGKVSLPPFFPCRFSHCPSLCCEVVEETSVLQELKWVSKVVSAFVIHVCLSDVVPQCFRTQTWRQVCGEAVHGLQPLLFSCPVSFKAQLGACLQRIYLCIFCIVYYHFAKYVFAFWMSKEYLRLHSCDTCSSS